MLGFHFHLLLSFLDVAYAQGHIRPGAPGGRRPLLPCSFALRIDFINFAKMHTIFRERMPGQCTENSADTLRSLARARARYLSIYVSIYPCMYVCTSRNGNTERNNG
ncbi:hypothetical protein DFH11DRAFT_829740 [Phellopilus nigrolimitatus]|nr:hypothetical protein DFH11DRAFT_829740 [Phellopilus nigrolimitatus]